MSGAQPTPSPTEAARWLAKADDDLTVATLILQSSSGPRWAACFHAQQAAEKALKAVLVFNATDFPFMHGLERLADLAAVDLRGVDRATLINLTPWAVAGRYPEDIPEPSATDTGQLVDGARSIVAAVREHLGLTG